LPALKDPGLGSEGFTSRHCGAYGLAKTPEATWLGPGESP